MTNKTKAPILVSACLAGIKCRYDGASKDQDDIIRMVEKGEAIPVCPEELGGLPTPRPPSEQRGDQVFSIHGEDKTKEFHKGAKRALEIFQEKGCREAYLKSKSPMCGCGKIYDGSFSGKLIEGDGIFTKLLKDLGIKTKEIP